MQPYCKEDDKLTHLSPLHLAWHRTTTVCAPCRILDPADPPGTSSPDFPTFTSIGVLQTCEPHYEAFCTNCLSPFTHDDPPVGYSDANDINESGIKRLEGAFTCRGCRHSALVYALNHELPRCGRSGFLPGVHASLLNTPSAQDYLLNAEGVASVVARHAVEELFFAQHTRWDEYEADFHALQSLLLKLKCLFYLKGVRGPTPQERAEYHDLVTRIWSAEYSDFDDEPTLAQFYSDWVVEHGSATYGHYHYKRDVDRYQRSTNYLSPFLRKKRVDLCLNSWVNDRVYYGFWIMPSDEIQRKKSVRAPFHSSFLTLAKTSVRPPDVLQNEHIYAQCIGRFSDNLFDEACLPPPQHILAELDLRFSATLQRRLEIPFSELVEYKRMDLSMAEAEHFACSVGLPQLLRLLRKEMLWTEGSHKHRPVKAQQSVPDEKLETDGNPLSPRIEFIKDETHLVGEFAINEVIQEGWLSPTDMGEDPDHWSDEDDVHDREPSTYSDYDVDALDDSDEIEEDEYVRSPAEHQRGSLQGEQAIALKPVETDVEREVDDEPPMRPRLGSGRTSHSSSDTANTALVTPDDSPDLMAGAIQLMDEEPQASQPAAGDAAPAPASPASSHGRKRKLPDGDTDSERHARRRSSRSPSASSPKEGKTDHGHRDEDDVSRRIVNLTESQPKQQSNDRNALPSAPPTPPTPVKHVTSANDNTKNARHWDDEESEGDVISIEDIYFEDIEDDSASSDSGSEADSDIEYGVPYIPPADVQLGPGATAIIREAWMRASAPLCECHCNICERAKSLDLAHRLLAVWDYGSLKIG